MKLLRLKFILTFLLFLGAASLLVAFNYSYSDGNRAGYVQKFSHKGWVCKTHEGELAMTTVPGVAPVLWNFSVWDEKVAAQLANILENGAVTGDHVIPEATC